MFAAVRADNFLLFTLRELSDFEEVSAAGVVASDSPNGSNNFSHSEIPLIV